MWNALLSARIALVDAVLKVVQACPDPGSLNLRDSEWARLLESSEPFHQLQLDILAPVSFSQLDFIPLSGVSPSSGFSSRGHWWNFPPKEFDPWRSCRQSSADFPFMRMSGAYLIQWSLYVAGAVDDLGGNERKWVIQTLKVTGESMSLQQALVLANQLETNDGMQVNTHMSFRPT